MIFCPLPLAYEPTRISSAIGMSIQLLHTSTTPRFSELGGYATLPHPVQPQVAASSSA
jgi:hypothetical protein